MDEADGFKTGREAGVASGFWWAAGLSPVHVCAGFFQLRCFSLPAFEKRAAGESDSEEESSSGTNSTAGLWRWTRTASCEGMLVFYRNRYNIFLEAVARTSLEAMLMAFGSPSGLVNCLGGTLSF